MNEAAMAAVEEKFSKIEAGAYDGTLPHTIKAAHFELALGKITPSVSDKVLTIYMSCPLFTNKRGVH